MSKPEPIKYQGCHLCSLMLKAGENKMFWNKLSNLCGSVKIAFVTLRFLHSFKGVIFGWQFDSRSLRPAQATITRTVAEVAPMSESKLAA